MPRRPPARITLALVLIDSRPLRHAAWSEFHAARKLSEKAARDLHRHEETDTPSYHAWLHAAFPQLMTTLRELHAEVLRKTRQLDQAQFEANITGRSVKKIWKDHREYDADPEAYERAHPPEPEPPPHRFDRDTIDDASTDPFDDPAFDDFSDTENIHHRDDQRPAPAASADARDIYRRLVQHLHPDRGGDWTPARERLWHEVQQAWAARDADWLARLEIDWETANDTVTPDSSLSRLRQAIAALHAARRDTERKLRFYRQSPSWRFTLSAKKRPQLQRRLEADLHADLNALQRQLAYINHTIAAWESPLPSRRPRTRRT